MKAIVALFALVLVAALGAMAAGSIADAVATWSDAQVQIAQIDANVKMYQIGIDAVQRANDRAAAWFMIGALTVVGALALPWLLRNFEDEGDYHARQDRRRSSARQVVDVHTERITDRYERIEERRERTVERYAPPAVPQPERQFKIVGQREEWPAPQLAQTDAGITDFIPGTGDLRRMEAGWMWIGNNGEKIFFPVQQWVELSAADARALGFLLAENRRIALVLRTIVEQRRPQLAANDRRKLR